MSTPFDGLKIGFYGLDLKDNVFYYSNEDGYYKFKVEYTISNYAYCYTFGNGTDYSINGGNYNNVIKKCKVELNNIVFLDNDCNNNTFGYDCRNNTFGWFCCFNTFGNECYSNSFGSDCDNNTFCNQCYSNSFGNGCDHNILGDQCNSNTFGSACHSNIFDSDCKDSTLGDDCTGNRFGNGCVNNRLGDYCKHNILGDDCAYNTFGNDCDSNILGDYCKHNTLGYSCVRNILGNVCGDNILGNVCANNTFGDMCVKNSFRTSDSSTAGLKYYVEFNHFDDGCSYNVIWNSDTTGSASLLQNINVNRGVSGSGAAYNIINIDTLNAGYEIHVAKNSKGEIKIYCEADLIA